MRAQAALPGRARPWHLLQRLRTFLVFLRPFFLLVYFKSPSERRGELAEAEIS